MKHGAHLIQIAFGMRPDCSGESGLGVIDASELERPVVRAERIAADRMRELGNATNIAGADGMHRRLLFAANRIELPDPLLLAGAHIEDGGVRMQLAGEDAYVAQLADVGVG